MDMAVVDGVLAALAGALAISLRPWRAIGSAGPPWAWVIAWATLPLLWSLDRQLGVPMLPPLSGAALLVLMTGWPLAVLACIPMALLAAVCGPLELAEALHRAVWLGILPATAALALGAAIRRWLPHHVAVYVMGRGFLATGIGIVLVSTLRLLGATAADDDAWIVQLLMAMAEAGTTGALVTLLVVHRPGALATYADRLYLEAPSSIAVSARTAT